MGMCHVRSGQTVIAGDVRLRFETRAGSRCSIDAEIGDKTWRMSFSAAGDLLTIRELTDVEKSAKK